MHEEYRLHNNIHANSIGAGEGESTRQRQRANRCDVWREAQLMCGAVGGILGMNEWTDS